MPQFLFFPLFFLPEPARTAILSHADKEADSDNDDAGNDGDSDDIGPGIWSPNSKKSTPSSSSKSSGTKAAKPLVASSLMFDD